jgi:hypothetical protein
LKCHTFESTNKKATGVQLIRPSTNTDDTAQILIEKLQIWIEFLQWIVTIVEPLGCSCKSVDHILLSTVVEDGPLEPADTGVDYLTPVVVASALLYADLAVTEGHCNVEPPVSTVYEPLGCPQCKVGGSYSLVRRSTGDGPLEPADTGMDCLTPVVVVAALLYADLAVAE